MVQKNAGGVVSRYRTTLAALSARTGTALPSLITSFAILHEATAVVPLVGVFYACKAMGVGERVVALARRPDGEPETWLAHTRDRWMADGEAWAGRVGRRYGIWGFEKGATTTTTTTDDGDTRPSHIAGDVANALVAYCATKALLPVRVGLSLYLSPAFARRVVDPLAAPIHSKRVAYPCVRQSTMKKLFKSHPKHPSPAASVSTNDDHSDAHPRSISPFLVVPAAAAMHMAQEPVYDARGDRLAHQYPLQQQAVPRERREHREQRDHTYRNSKIIYSQPDDDWEAVVAPDHAQRIQYGDSQSVSPAGLTSLPNPYSPALPSSRKSSVNSLPPGASPPIPAPPVTSPSSPSQFNASPTSPVIPQLANTNTNMSYYNMLRKKSLPSHPSPKDPAHGGTGTAAILRALDPSILGLGTQQHQKAPSSLSSVPSATRARGSHSLSGSSENTQRHRRHSLSLSDIEFEAAESDLDSLEQERERVWRDRDREINDTGPAKGTSRREHGRERERPEREREMNAPEKEKFSLLRKVRPDDGASQTSHTSGNSERVHEREREGKGFFDRLQLQSEGEGRRKRDGSHERRERNVSKEYGREVRDGREDRKGDKKEDRKLQWNALFSSAREKDKDKERIKGRLSEFETSDVHADPLARMVGLFVSPSFEAIDWTLALEICERTFTSESDAKSIAKSLRKELKYARPAEQLGAATLWAVMLQNASDSFITQTSSRKFLDVVEDTILNPGAGLVRDRLLEVLSAAVYLSAEKGGKDASKRENFRSLWRKVKPEDYPDEGMPLSTDNAMFRSKSGASHLDKHSPNAAVYVDDRRRPPAPDRRPSKNGIIPVDEDIRRLLQECKIGRGNARLLNEALAFASPSDLKEKEIIKEFFTKCRASQELIYAQIPWASAGAERSRSRQQSSNDPRLNAVPETPTTREERLLAELLGANEELTDALKIYSDIERIGLENEVEQTARERSRVDFRANGIGVYASDEALPPLHTPSTAPSSSRSASPMGVFVASQTPQIPFRPQYETQHSEQTISVLPQHPTQPALMSTSNSSHGQLLPGTLPLPSRALRGPRSPAAVASLHSRSSSPVQTSRPSSRSHSRNSSVDLVSDTVQAPVGLSVSRHNIFYPSENEDAVSLASVGIGAAMEPSSDKAGGKRKMADAEAELQNGLYFCWIHQRRCDLTRCIVAHEDYRSEEPLHLETSEPPRHDDEIDEGVFNETLRPGRWKSEVRYVYDAAAERTKERLKESMARNGLT
ncbi:hypothetical protein M0805_004510 [Coniferiporia weirii]|nr:hypothetical protein M0805_004510 [Coniferiporia weirii]